MIETGPLRNFRIRLTDGLEHSPKACVFLMASPCFQFSVSFSAQEGRRQSRRHDDKRRKIFRGMPFHGKACPQDHLVVPSKYENSLPVAVLPPMLCNFLGGVRVSKRESDKEGSYAASQTAEKSAPGRGSEDFVLSETDEASAADAARSVERKIIYSSDVHLVLKKTNFEFDKEIRTFWKSTRDTIRLSLSRATGDTAGRANGFCVYR